MRHVHSRRRMGHTAGSFFTNATSRAKATVIQIAAPSVSINRLPPVTKARVATGCRSQIGISIASALVAPAWRSHTLSCTPRLAPKKLAGSFSTRARNAIPINDEEDSGVQPDAKGKRVRDRSVSKGLHRNPRSVSREPCKRSVNTSKLGTDHGRDSLAVSATSSRRRNSRPGGCRARSTSPDKWARRPTPRNRRRRC